MGSAAGLSGFTVDLAETGGRIRVARARLVEALRPLAQNALEELSGGGELLDLRYSLVGSGPTAEPDDSLPEVDGALAAGVTAAPEGPPPPEDLAAAAAALHEELESRHAEELARGVTVAGPHRDDLVLLLNGRPARGAASQGQQRSIVLALKLAEVRHLAAVMGMAPVLILDDVLSELDPARRRQLLEALGAGRQTQVLLSSTEADAVAGLELGGVRRHQVRAGRVVSLEPGEPTGAPRDQAI